MFDKKDIVHLKNLQKLLGKSKIELEGQEILAAADVWLWVGRLEQKIIAQIEQQEAKTKLMSGVENKGIAEPSTTQSLPDKTPVKKHKKSSSE